MNETVPLQEAIENALVRYAGAAAEPRTTPVEVSGDVIANWIGSQIARMLTNEGDREILAGVGDLFGHINSGLAHYAQLHERDIELAAAVGACTCWGNDSRCDVCGGSGSPGWEQPDQDLFVRFIAPALFRVTNSTG